MVAIHRDKAGDIVCANLALIAAIPAGESVRFETPSLSGVGLRKLVGTDINYRSSAIP